MLLKSGNAQPIPGLEYETPKHGHLVIMRLHARPIIKIWAMNGPKSLTVDDLLHKTKPVILPQILVIILHEALTRKIYQQSSLKASNTYYTNISMLI